MPKTPKAGTTVLMPLDRIALTPHLWVFLCDPHGDPPKSIIVMITTKRSESDTTCVLDKGDHPFIRHASVIRYEDADIFKTENFVRLVKQDRAKFKEPMSPIVLKKIQDGILKSRYTPKKVKNFWQDVML